MNLKDDLGTRMKGYEQRNRYYLQKRVPVIIRLDMRAGHTFTRGLKRPFDEIFMNTMQETAKYLCENIQNCKLAYIQSDEITLVLVDYDKLNTDSFFDYRVDKLCSITASLATLAFNKFFTSIASNWIDNYYESWNRTEEEEKYEKTLKKAMEKGAVFDARCFNIPKDEVTNCIYWRQLDASRNSIQMVGQANFTHKELQGKSCNDIQDMLMTQKSINWNDFPTYQKRGSCIVKKEYFIEDITAKTRWIVDKDIPLFKGEGREYIEALINF